MEQLELCKKRDLYEISKNYELPVSTAWVKGELKAAILTSLVEQGVLVVPGSDSPGLVAASEDPAPGSPELLAASRSSSGGGGGTVKAGGTYS